MTENKSKAARVARTSVNKAFNNGNKLRVIFISLGLFFLYAPILSLIIYSFNASKMMTVWGGFSIKWYFELFKDYQMMSAVGTSLWISFCTASMSVVIGTLAAIVLARINHFKGESLFALFITAPMVLPEVIVGLSMLLLFVTLTDFTGWPQSRGMITIWISMVTVTTAYVTVVVRGRLCELDNSIEEAALDLGAGPIKTFFAITLPSILPAIISGWLLAFTLTMDDLVITSFVAGPNSSTLPIVVFSSVRRGLNPEINALATIIVFIVSLCTFAYWLIRTRAEKKRRIGMVK